MNVPCVVTAMSYSEEHTRARHSDSALPIRHRRWFCMYLKVIIVILLIGVIASLVSGLVFLFQDSDKPESRRTLHALGVRVTLAAALVATIFYGLYTGQLRMGTNAPWHGHHSASEEPSAPGG